jgi:hypothetical protein
MARKKQTAEVAPEVTPQTPPVDANPAPPAPQPEPQPETPTVTVEWINGLRVETR